MKVFVAVLLCLGLVSSAPWDIHKDMDAVTMMELNERDGIPREGYTMHLNKGDEPPPPIDEDIPEPTEQLPMPMSALNEEDPSSYEHCGSLMKAGYTVNGTYIINVNGSKVVVPCAFGPRYAFTIFLNRVDSRLSWNQHISTFMAGFGHPLHDYFVGLNNLHLLTATRHDGLMAHFMDWHSNERWSSYTHFHVGPASSGYRLYLGGLVRGNVHADLSLNNGQAFRTASHDNAYHCAHQKHTGWWFVNAGYCTAVLPTGHYYNGVTAHYDGIFWYHYTNSYRYSMKKMVLSIAHFY